MGKLTDFSIHFNSPQPVYYPGQTIVGYISVNLKEPMNMDRLTIKLNGEGRTEWSERHTTGAGNNRKTVTRHYSGHETIIKLVQNMFNGSTHPAGAYTYPFAFPLSTNMPSSFEGHYGHIRYILKAKIIKPWRFDHKVKCAISVNDLIDTNNPMYSLGVGGEKHKEVGCLCCTAGPLDLNASIDRSAYCPGETILINAHAQNNTTRDMQNMHAKLIRTVTFAAQHHGLTEHKIDTKEITRLGGPPIPKGESAKWSNQPFGIPATVPTIVNSNLITVQYKLKVIVGVPWGLDPAVEMYITMGTVPYLRTYGHTEQYQYGTPQDQEAGPPQANLIGGHAYPPPQPNLMGYTDMAPPSYSTVVGDSGVNIKGEKDEHTLGEMNYTPVYTFAQPYQGEYAPPLPQCFMPTPPDDINPPPYAETATAPPQ